jgi:hypothetical protein
MDFETIVKRRRECPRGYPFDVGSHHRELGPAERSPAATSPRSCSFCTQLL